MLYQGELKQLSWREWFSGNGYDTSDLMASLAVGAVELPDCWSWFWLVGTSSAGRWRLVAQLDDIVAR